ncbi:MAG: hypothetical protein AMXMBFR58_02680 [Phycisphaerae bacterium]
MTHRVHPTSIRAWLIAGCAAAGLMPALALAKPTGQPTPQPVSSPGESRPAEPVKDLASTLGPIREKHKVPALAAAIVTLAGLDSVGAVGLRAADRTEQVQTGDRFHLGSCTKAMTSTLIAILIEEGVLAWDTTLAQALPDLQSTMHEKYRDVTISDLLTQRSGVPTDLNRDGVWAELWKNEGPIQQQREKCTSAVLAWGPDHDKSRFVYSNTNFIIAGHIAERATGKSWEELMQARLFYPLGMTTAGFGAPGTAGKYDQPVGHRGNGAAVPVGPGSDNPPALGPAGTVHASMEDWGKFITLHLRGAKAAAEGGEVRVGPTAIRAETWKKLHTPVKGNGADYAMGWGLADRPWAKGPSGDSRTLTHSGSNTMWFCVVWAAPDAGFAVLSATNVMGDNAQRACDQACSENIKSYLENHAGR